MDAYTIGVGNPDPDAYDAGNAFYSLTWNAQRDAWEYRPRYVHGSTLPIRIANADAADHDADSDFELDSPNWLYNTLPHGERVNDPRRNRAADRHTDQHADFYRGPHSWRDWLHALRLPWWPVRGGGGAAPWQRALSAGRRVLGAVRSALGRHG